MRFALCLAVICSAAFAQTVDIGVFSLFRPVELVVKPADGPILVTSGASRRILEGRQSATIRLASIRGTVRVASRDGSPAAFVLAVPGRISRRYEGVLTVRAGDHKLIPVVTMDLETAVAAVAAAEMPPATPMEALKAQAVVARSFFAASGRRHDDYAFCDTTHCQFLREPTTQSRQAAEATRGLLLEYLGRPVAAMYSAACGGRTRSLSAPDGGYSYRSVECEYCRRHSPGDVRGHQLGLCQAGAAGMASLGATFRAILDHYLPATALSESPPRPFSIFLLPPPSPLRHIND